MTFSGLVRKDIYAYGGKTPGRTNITLNTTKSIFILFSVQANKFRWIKAYILASFTLVEVPYLAGINISDVLLQNIMIMATYCMFYFYSHTS